MSENDWRRKYTIGLITAGVLAAFVSGWLWTSTDSLQARIEHHTAEQIAHYTQTANVAVERKCAYISETERLECVEEERQTAHETERNERDLEAQRIMALWTRTMGIAAVIGMGVGMFGLGLIFTTFRETRRAADAAYGAVAETRRLGEAQTRAYLSAVKADFSHDPQPRGKYMIPKLDLVIHLANSGQTPAINVSYCCAARVVPWKDRDALPIFEECKGQTFITSIIPDNPVPVSVLCFGLMDIWLKYKEEWIKVTEDTPFGAFPMLMFYGAVFYEDVFGQRFRSTFVFLLEGVQPNGLPIAKNDLSTVQAAVTNFEPVDDRSDSKRHTQGRTQNDGTRHREGA